MKELVNTTPLFAGDCNVDERGPLGKSIPGRFFDFSRDSFTRPILVIASIALVVSIASIIFYRSKQGNKGSNLARTSKIDAQPLTGKAKYKAEIEASIRTVLSGLDQNAMTSLGSQLNSLIFLEQRMLSGVQRNTVPSVLNIFKALNLYSETRDPFNRFKAYQTHGGPGLYNIKESISIYQALIETDQLDRLLVAIKDEGEEYEEVKLYLEKAKVLLQPLKVIKKETKLSSLLRNFID